MAAYLDRLANLRLFLGTVLDACLSITCNLNMRLLLKIIFDDELGLVERLALGERDETLHMGRSLLAFLKLKDHVLDEFGNDVLLFVPFLLRVVVDGKTIGSGARHFLVVRPKGKKDIADLAFQISAQKWMLVLPSTSVFCGAEHIFFGFICFKIYFKTL